MRRSRLQFVGLLKTAVRALSLCRRPMAVKHTMRPACPGRPVKVHEYYYYYYYYYEYHYCNLLLFIINTIQLLSYAVLFGSCWTFEGTSRSRRFDSALARVWLTYIMVLCTWRQNSRQRRHQSSSAYGIQGDRRLRWFTRGALSTENVTGAWKSKILINNYWKQNK